MSTSTLTVDTPISTSFMEWRYTTLQYKYHIIVRFPPQETTSLAWIADILHGAELRIQVTDRGGNTNTSDEFIMGQSSNSSTICANIATVTASAPSDHTISSSDPSSSSPSSSKHETRLTNGIIGSIAALCALILILSILLVRRVIRRKYSSANDSATSLENRIEVFTAQDVEFDSPQHLIEKSPTQKASSSEVVTFPVTSPTSPIVEIAQPPPANISTTIMQGYPPGEDYGLGSPVLEDIQRRLRQIEAEIRLTPPSYCTIKQQRDSPWRWVKSQLSIYILIGWSGFWLEWSDGPSAMSASPLTVDTPVNVTVCESVQLSWKGGKPSYNISILSSPGGDLLRIFSLQKGTSCDWTADISNETALVLQVTDQYYKTKLSNQFTVNQSSLADTSCINTASGVVSELSTYIVLNLPSSPESVHRSSPIASTLHSTTSVVATSTPDGGLSESTSHSITSTTSTSQYLSPGPSGDSTSSLSTHSNSGLSKGTIGAITVALITLVTLIIAIVLVRRARRRKSIHDASVSSWPPEVYIETFTAQDSDLISSTDGLTKATTRDGAQTSTAGSVSDALSPTVEKAPAASALQKSVVGDIRW
ncbi:uncharacterized protein STEHIDRAFT_108223 [Stereum hirsutum FP-91666 SS1]|uniref:uncharacterized protein n=1 Tax=Stereum hirsutum (strain FP-91666) TaxID=721885 RepID=UPI000440C8A5|nr:uncharacterized protein STEHIDRAFT_108223 [Stereum hirsutum FP-91666 SS1]EIM89501.1 hypothetical protein STEHIDRAFT_108223 [Stereum hirsutum FP-91666 SS1]